MATDPFGAAIRDQYRAEKMDPLVLRDGPDSQEHTVQRYLDEPSAEWIDWLDPLLDGPLLDMGAGAGRHARYFQEQFETVAVEVSEPLVETMTERGVDDARHVDMFDLRSEFERDRFRSAFAAGTQVGLAGSIPGLRTFLGDLGYVTTPDALVTFPLHDPAWDGTSGLTGFRPDPAPGLASRVMHFEYDGTVGETLMFRQVSPDRLREATLGTQWSVARIEEPTEPGSAYQAILEKQS